jgi:hypothetical protein
MKSAWQSLAILLLLPIGSAAGQPSPQQQQGQQNDSSSIADAARRSREQKKEQAKSAKVWDNDTIPKKPGELSVIGQAPAATDDSAAAATGTPTATAAEPARCGN